MPASLAAWAATTAFPAFSRPSESTTMRFASPRGSEAWASWIARAMFVARPPAGAWGRLKVGLGRSGSASCGSAPNVTSPARSPAFMPSSAAVAQR